MHGGDRVCGTHAVSHDERDAVVCLHPWAYCDVGCDSGEWRFDDQLREASLVLLCHLHDCLQVLGTLNKGTDIFGEAEIVGIGRCNQKGEGNCDERRHCSTDSGTGTKSLAHVTKIPGVGSCSGHPLATHLLISNF